jgi:nucleoside-diphosphate-sugar epimerase
MRVLITGHRGFVGKHFIKKFNAEGHTIVGIDIKDEVNPTDCRDFFKTNTEVFDLVIHLAAIVGGRATIEGEPLSVATDLSIDAEMFNWAVKTKQKKIVYFSSSAAYPTKLQVKGLKTKLKESDINLDDISNPDFTYGWAKLTGEYLAQFARQAGIKVYIFRPFSGYGELQDLDYPFPSFIKRVVDRADPFIIWGDGTQVRDFIHMDDICDAVMEVVNNDLPTPLNLGTGIATSFNELAKLMFEIEDWKPKDILHKIDKPSGVMYRCCDETEFFKIFKPKISLEEGIRRSLSFYKTKGK